ncbi:MAG TPA: hypothetical protein VF275_11835 [Gammaproteobacteria bacterium]
MTATTTNSVMSPPRNYRPILYGGLLAGTLDILAAIVKGAFDGLNAEIILQSVASGLLGGKAFDPGIVGAATGLLLHFLIMFVIGAIFVAASRRIAFLLRHTVVSGVLYGVGVYLVMNFVVLPLSAIPFQLNYSVAEIIIGLSIHVTCVGLPIAWTMKHCGGKYS